MGLFDDDSSSDDNETTPCIAAAANTSGGGGDYNDEDEEEDPLDAYMKSLDAATAIPSSSSSAAKRHVSGGRLDVDAEDEATSHWEVVAAVSGSSSSKRLLPQHDEEPQAQQQEARSAMSNTFVRAGAGRKSNEQDTINSANNDRVDDGIDDDVGGSPFDNLQKLRQHQKQMMHQEVDPLEHTNHRDIQYQPFRRIFYTPPDTTAGQAWRKEHDIVCTPSTFDPILGFDGSYAFPEELLRAIAKAGYDSPTLVQSQTLAVALNGKDALITAATGSGKTLAYIWPMIVHINDQPHITPGVDGPISIVLTPTRELAKQVFKYAKTFIECIGGTAVEVAGGNRGTWELTKELKKGCEVVVSTPGRLIDMVKKKGTNLRRVTFLVLDEADRMLDMGFEKQVNSILGSVRPDRQTLLLSATFGKRVERSARGWLRSPVRIAIGRTGASSEHVDSHVMVLPSRDAKIQWLMEMLPILSPLGRCLVFVATRADCDHLTRMIQNLPSFVGGASNNGTTTTSSNNTNGTIIVSIHGEKDQRDRNSAISQFKKNSQAILIATDVAARGLDVPNVMVVINFDAAKNIDSHVHRVGRAGRLSKDDAGGQHQRGVAYTLLTAKKDANFAISLAEAFEREGREVSEELAVLCQKSSRFGGGRKKHSRDGLGFGTSEGTTRASEQNHYGPSSNQLTKKKSRWG